ncbi:hypothetical protein [Streptomyces flaveolus]|uniref:hypothetical protein n=1 Tax=Streptomyces flaveolus TaxID=67297 RepID=UPI00341F52A3
MAGAPQHLGEHPGVAARGEGDDGFLDLGQGLGQRAGRAGAVAVVAGFEDEHGLTGSR